MKKWQSRCLHAACISILSAGLWGGSAFAGQSSCVTCHIDEDMLDETVTVVQKKGSAKQSGAG